MSIIQRKRQINLSMDFLDYFTYNPELVRIIVLYSVDFHAFLALMFSHRIFSLCLLKNDKKNLLKRLSSKIIKEQNNYDVFHPYLQEIFYALPRYRNVTHVDKNVKFVKHGSYVCYFEKIKKKIYMKGNYRKGKKHGFWTDCSSPFFEQSGKYKNGRKEGKWTKTSNIRKETIKLAVFTYSDGVLHGTFKKYFSNEVVAKKGRYENGKKKGRWEKYNRIGQLLSVSNK